MTKEQALAEVKLKVAELQAAIFALDKIVDTHSFGLLGWIDSLDSDLFDLEEDLTETEEE